MQRGGSAEEYLWFQGVWGRVDLRITKDQDNHLRGRFLSYYQVYFWGEDLQYDENSIQYQLCLWEIFSSAPTVHWLICLLSSKEGCRNVHWLHVLVKFREIRLGQTSRHSPALNPKNTQKASAEGAWGPISKGRKQNQWLNLIISLAFFFEWEWKRRRGRGRRAGNG